MEGRTAVVSKRTFAGKALLSVLALTVVLAGMLVLSGPASAQESSSITCTVDAYDTVCKEEQDKDFSPDVDAEVLTRPGTPPDDGETLPFTGADVTLFVITGAALVATGILIVRRARANRSEV